MYPNEFFLPQEFLLEARDFTVFLTTASTSTLEWSPIQVLTMAHIDLTGTGVFPTWYYI